MTSGRITVRFDGRGTRARAERRLPRHASLVRRGAGRGSRVTPPFGDFARFDSGHNSSADPMSAKSLQRLNTVVNLVSGWTRLAAGAGAISRAPMTSASIRTRTACLAQRRGHLADCSITPGKRANSCAILTQPIWEDGANPDAAVILLRNRVWRIPRAAGRPGIGGIRAGVMPRKGDKLEEHAAGNVATVEVSHDLPSPTCDAKTRLRSCCRPPCVRWSPYARLRLDATYIPRYHHGSREPCLTGAM